MFWGLFKRLWDKRNLSSLQLSIISASYKCQKLKSLFSLDASDVKAKLLITIRQNIIWKIGFPP